MSDPAQPGTMAAELASPLGTAVRQAARTALEQADPWRARDVVVRQFPSASAELVRAALAQAEFADLARARFGEGDWLGTREGLQMATRPDVAARRAGRLADGGVRTIAEIGCALGADTRALAAAGLNVRALEIDPETADMARHNTKDLEHVTITTADALDTVALSRLLDGADAVFVDPARRAAHGPSADGNRVAAERDPQRWSPPWSWVTALPLPWVAKVAPGIPQSFVPDGATIEWVCDDGDLVEACIWTGHLASTARRRAVSLVGGDLATIDSGADLAPTDGSISRYLIEPVESVVRADLVSQLGTTLSAHRLSDNGLWLSSNSLVDSALARTWTVLDEVPHDAKKLGAHLKAQGFGSATFKTADVRISAADLEKRIRPQLTRGGGQATVTFVQCGSATRAFLVDLV